MLNRRYARTATTVNAPLTTGGEAIIAATSNVRAIRTAAEWNSAADAGCSKA